MIKISFYRTQTEDCIKTLCQISEKCYYNNFKTLIITDHEDNLYNIDKSLWTYSKIHFLPHATIHDPRLNDQCILVTTKPHNFNNAEVIVFIRITQQILLNYLSQNQELKLDHIVKIIIIYDNDNIIPASIINIMMNTYNIKVETTQFFIKTIEGNWQNRKIV